LQKCNMQELMQWQALAQSQIPVTRKSGHVHIAGLFVDPWVISSTLLGICFGFYAMGCMVHFRVKTLDGGSGPRGPRNYEPRDLHEICLWFSAGNSPWSLRHCYKAIVHGSHGAFSKAILHLAGSIMLNLGIKSNLHNNYQPNRIISIEYHNTEQTRYVKLSNLSQTSII
jgi:hypothetical protein